MQYVFVTGGAVAVAVGVGVPVGVAVGVGAVSVFEVGADETISCRRVTSLSFFGSLDESIMYRNDPVNSTRFPHCGGTLPVLPLVRLAGGTGTGCSERHYLGGNG